MDDREFTQLRNYFIPLQRLVYKTLSEIGRTRPGEVEGIEELAYRMRDWLEAEGIPSQRALLVLLFLLVMVLEMLGILPELEVEPGEESKSWVLLSCPICGEQVPGPELRIHLRTHEEM